MNVHSLSNRSRQFSGIGRPGRLNKPASQRSFKTRDPATVLADDATSVGPDMAPAVARQSAADWVAQQTARWKQSRSNRKARKRQFP